MHSFERFVVVFNYKSDSIATSLVCVWSGCTVHRQLMKCDPFQTAVDADDTWSTSPSPQDGRTAQNWHVRLASLHLIRWPSSSTRWSLSGH